MTHPTEERRAELRAKAEALINAFPQECEEDIRGLLAWIDALEAALRPFADCAGDFEDDDDEDDLDDEE